MIRSNAQRLVHHHSKTLATGLVLAALVATGMTLIPKTAHADTTFVVTSTADPGNGVCDAVCTPREAITAANDTPGGDTINFRLSNTGEVRTIRPASELPVITEAVTIDGYSQLGQRHQRENAYLHDQAPRRKTAGCLAALAAPLGVDAEGTATIVLLPWPSTSCRSCRAR